MGVYRGSVSKGSVKGLCVGVEQVFDVCQTLDLELLRFFLNHLPNTKTGSDQWLTTGSFSLTLTLT